VNAGAWIAGKEINIVIAINILTRKVPWEMEKN